MKLTINTSFPENGSSQSLLILVDSEQLQNTTSTYQINNLDRLIEASHFKAALAESLCLIGQVSQSGHAALIGLGKVAELQPAKLATIAQTIIQTTQKTFKQDSVDVTQHPLELHYLVALLSTQASYAYDEYKSKKNEFVLEQIDLIATHSILSTEQLQLVQAVQSGQNLARDLGNRPGNICFPEYLADQAVA